MATRAYTDLWFTPDGDLMIDSTGDLRGTNSALEPNAEALKQMIFHRIATEANGWPRYPHICAAMEQFIGKPINENTIQAIEARIKYVLTHDNAVNPQDLVVRGIMLGLNSIAIVLFLKNIQNTPLVTFSFDMTTGGITRTA